MFHKNLQKIRKQKGLSQEMLAMQLHVVRQTVSKWEKGLSVPDADMLIKLADILEVDVGTLLGSEITDSNSENEITEHLARIVEQLALINRRQKRFWKAMFGIFLAVIIFVVYQIYIRNITSNYNYTGSVSLHKNMSDISGTDVRDWIAACDNSDGSYFILYSSCAKGELNEGYAGKFLIYVPEGFSAIHFYINDDSHLISRGKKIDFQIGAPFTQDSTYKIALIETQSGVFSQITMQSPDGTAISPVITETRDYSVYEK